MLRKRLKTPDKMSIGGFTHPKLQTPFCENIQPERPEGILRDALVPDAARKLDTVINGNLSNKFKLISQ